MKQEYLFDSCEDGLFAFDVNGIITVWNRNLENQFGITKDDCIDKKVAESSLFVNQSNFYSIVARLLNGKKYNSKHNVYQSANQKIYYYSLALTPVRDPNNNIVGGLGTIKDLVSVDSASSIHSINNMLLTDDSLPRVVFSTEGKPIYFNDSYKLLWGLTPKTEKYVIENYNLFDDEQLVNLNLIEQIKKGVKGNKVEVPLINYDPGKTQLLRRLKSGEKKLSGIIRPYIDEEGKVSQLEITLVDLSDYGKKNIDPVFYQKFQKLTNKLPGVIYEFITKEGEEGYFSYISQSCYDLFGYTDEQIRHEPKLLKNCIHQDDIVGYIQSVKKADDNFSDWEWEGRFVVNGQDKWIRGSSRPELLIDNTVVRYGMLMDVSEEKTAQNKQKDTKIRLDLALKGGNLGLWDWDLNNSQFNFNDRLAEIVGYEMEELSASLDDWMTLIHEDDQEKCYNKIIKHLKGDAPFFEIELRTKTKSGGWKWVTTRAQVTDRDSDGKATRLAGTLQDIHNRKQYEKVLADSEQRYRGLVEYSPIAIVIYCENEIVFANSQAYRLLKAEDDVQIIGKDVLDFVHPDSRSKTKLQLDKVYDNKKASPSVEEKLVCVDGEEVIVEMVGIPYVFNGKPAIQITASDITEKITAEKVLKRNEKLLSQLFESVPMGMVLLDANKKVVQINKGFKDMFGYSSEEAFGKKLNQMIIPQGYRDQSINLNTLIAEGNVIKEIESIRKDKSGNLIPVMIYGVPVTLNGKVIAIYGIYVDMSSSKKVEEELKVRNEELDNFVYKVSHDLRAPLSSTLGLIHLAKLEENDDDLRQYMSFIENRISQLDRFIADVLSHSKNLNVEVKNSKVNFSEIITQSFEELDYLVGADTITREVNVTGTIFFTDKWRISEVLRNLISNTIKYMNVETNNPFVRINITTTKKKAIIDFSDNGIGISEEMLPRIFEMFYRATEHSEGSGIGLYIVKNAILKMGGTIDISSKPYEGTSFHIELPNYGDDQ